MSTLTDLQAKLVKAQGELTNLVNAKAQQDSIKATMLTNLQSCDNTYGSGSSDALNCRAGGNGAVNYQNAYDSANNQSQALAGQIAAKNAEIASIQTSIDKDPANAANIAGATAGATAAEKVKQYRTIGIVIIVILILVFGFIWWRNRKG